MVAGNHPNVNARVFHRSEPGRQRFMADLFAVKGQIAGDDQGVRLLKQDFLIQRGKQFLAVLRDLSITGSQHPQEEFASLVQRGRQIMQIGNHHQLCFGCRGASCSRHAQNRQEHRRDPFHGIIAKPFFHMFLSSVLQSVRKTAKWRGRSGPCS